MVIRQSFTSIDQVAQVLGASPKWYQLDAGKFIGYLTRFIDDGVRFTRCEFNRSILMQTQTRAGFCTLLTQTQFQNFFNYGQPLKRDVLISTGDWWHFVRTLPNCQLIIVEIPLAKFALSLPSRGALCSTTERLQFWRQLRHCAERLVDRRYDLISSAQLVSTLINTIECEPDIEALCNQLVERRSQIRRAQQMIEEKFPDIVRISEFCTALQIPERTLRAQFDEVYGMPPTRVGKLHRLSQAYRMLEASHPSIASVTDIAHRCGFNHLSHFSQDYRSHFGCLPSQTLHQTAVELESIARDFAGNG